MTEVRGHLTLRVTSPRGFLYLSAGRVSYIGHYRRTEPFYDTGSCSRRHSTRSERKRHDRGECPDFSWRRERVAYQTKDGAEVLEPVNRYASSENPAHWTWYSTEAGAEIWTVDSWYTVVDSVEMLIQADWQRLE